MEETLSDTPEATELNKAIKKFQDNTKDILRGVVPERLSLGILNTDLGTGALTERVKLFHQDLLKVLKGERIEEKRWSKRYWMRLTSKLNQCLNHAYDESFSIPKELGEKGKWQNIVRFRAQIQAQAQIQVSDELETPEQTLEARAQNSLDIFKRQKEKLTTLESSSEIKTKAAELLIAIPLIDSYVSFFPKELEGEWLETIREVETLLIDKQLELFTEEGVEPGKTQLPAQVHLAIWKARAFRQQIFSQQTQRASEEQGEPSEVLKEIAGKLGINPNSTPLEFIYACKEKNEPKELEKYLNEIKSSHTVEIKLKHYRDNEVVIKLDKASQLFALSDLTPTESGGFKLINYTLSEIEIVLP